MTTNLDRSEYLRIIELEEKIRQLRKELKPGLGESCDPALRGKLDQEPEQGQLNFDWYNQVAELNDELNQILIGVLARRGQPEPGEFAPLTPDKLWLWGGPTPLWGGSMAADCLVREKDVFNLENAVYVYGETSEAMMQLHGGFKQLLCQVNSNCRTAGKLAGSEAENAELLSRLSLKYPNIKGAMCDDFATGFFHTLLPERFEKIYRGLKKYNALLQLYGVIYAHQLENYHFDFIQPYIDVVNFWLWNKTELLDIDNYVAQVRQKFPGKPIVLGLFIHEYGLCDTVTPPELLIYQLERAGVMLKKQWIEGVVILGDREIRKWPQATAAVQKFLQTDQYRI